MSAGALVGDDAARSVHGYSTGADVVLLGGPGPTPETVEGAALPDVGAALAELGLAAPVAHLAGSPSDQLAWLAESLESSDTVALVATAPDVRVSHVALLDLLDRPGVRTAALVCDPRSIVTGVDRAARARIGRDGSLLESVGTPAHTVTAPNRALAGILRVAGPDRATAARLLRAAAGSATASWGDDAITVATLVLVRGGVAVQAVTLGPFDWSRGATRGVGAAGGPWRQRLRGASRGGDGFFSTYAVRPLSRKLTGVGLAHGWSPNVVTVVSVVVGLVAALLVATGAWWAWVVAAVLLLVALVVDCVDGEIARFTRRFSPLGAFLDAVGDRVKEYAVLAAVAAVAVREGSPGWPVALAAMAAVTVRHLEDYAYGARIAPSRRSRPDLLPVATRADLGDPDGPTTFAPAPSARAQVSHWTRTVIHLPIGERYLLISLTLLTRRPMLVLWVLLVAVVLAVAWTQGGRVVLVLLRRDPTWQEAAPSRQRGELDEQLDLGPLAGLVARAVRAPFTAGLAGAVVLVAATPLLLFADRVGLALAALVVGAVLVAAGWQPAVHHPLGWQAPAALWVAEALTVGVLVHSTLGVESAAAFAYVAAIAYHRYDVVYRLRDTGVAPAPWVARTGLGTEGRLLIVLVVALVAPGALVPLLWSATVVLAVLYLGESATGWRRWIATQDDPLPTGAPA